MPEPAALVTGASSGIGRATVSHLASLGMLVWAGVRADEDGRRVRRLAPDNVRWVRLDVTDRTQVIAASERIAAERPLTHLVNNAGIAVNGPLELVSIDAVRAGLEVNVLGALAVTQAMLPMIREARGRVVNMSSIGGLMALPLLGPYNASKFALEGFSDSLRMELRPFGVHVALVEPGSVDTPIWEKGEADADAQLDSYDAERLDLYRPALDRMRVLASEAGARGIKPERVADAVAHALTAPRPRTRYRVGTGTRAIARRLPDRLRDRLILRAMGLR